jgi:translation elongation factor EF-1beta
MIAKFY